MRALLIVALCAFPLLAQAQIIIGGDEQKPQDDGKGPVEAVVQGTDFPASAITNVDEKGKVGGQLTSTPAPDPAAKDAKVIKESDEKWPRDTVSIFVTACAGTHKELVPSCKCTIEKVMVNIKHNEFLKLSKSGEIDADPRYQQARESCIGIPTQRQ